MVLGNGLVERGLGVVAGAVAQPVGFVVDDEGVACFGLGEQVYVAVDVALHVAEAEVLRGGDDFGGEVAVLGKPCFQAA